MHKMSKIYIIHENNEWTDHLTNRLTELGLLYEEWHLGQGMLDLFHYSTRRNLLQRN